MKDYQDNSAKKDAIGFIGMFILAGALMAASGCSGIEVGGRLGVYRVDERQESQRTYRNSTPLKCYFVSCSPASEEVQGS